jgi:hypothetical protein
LIAWPTVRWTISVKVARASYEHFASPAFWHAYEKLPETVRGLADKNYVLLKTDPRHPSLHFKKVGRYWSGRIGLRYRAFAAEIDGDFVWFWIGSHTDYDALTR